MSGGQGVPREEMADALRRGREVFAELRGDADIGSVTTTPLTQDYQDLAMSVVWGTIWSRPGLDRRTRSAITIAMLIARGYHAALPIHLQLALDNGLTQEEIGEILFHSHAYCGYPASTTAFQVAQEFFAAQEPSSDA